MLKSILHEENILSRMAPVPREIQLKLSCGVCLVIKEKDASNLESVLERHQDLYEALEILEEDLKEKRDQFC